MQQYIWRNFKIRLPDDWEMLQFSKNQQTGNCVFADKYQFRLEFNWREVKGTPDYDRMLTDYMSKLEHKHELKQGRYVQSGKWRGIEGYLNSLLTTRFGNYCKNESCVIEVVFLWPDKRNLRLEQNILDSIKEANIIHDFRQWKAFGMDMMVSKDMLLESAKIEPGNAKMVFSASKKYTKEIFKRIGMLPQWLKASVKEWLAEQVPKEVTVESKDTNFMLNHQIEIIRGYKFPDMSSRIFRKKTKYITSAWTCPNDGRLYNVTCTYPYSYQPGNINLAGKRLSCCLNLK